MAVDEVMTLSPLPPLLLQRLRMDDGITVKSVRVAMETWNKFEADKLEYALGGWNVLDQDHDGCVAAEETIRSLISKTCFQRTIRSLCLGSPPRLLNAATASIRRN